MSSQVATLSDTEKILIAALSQFGSEGSQFPPLNYSKLAEDLGLSTPNAASTRWSRLTSKIKSGKFGDLTIAPRGEAGGSAQKRKKGTAALDGDGDGNGEDMEDKATPTKKRKSVGTPRKRGGAKIATGGNKQTAPEGTVNNEATDGFEYGNDIMGSGKGSSFAVFEDSDAI